MNTNMQEIFYFRGIINDMSEYMISIFTVDGHSV